MCVGLSIKIRATTTMMLVDEMRRLKQQHVHFACESDLCVYHAGAVMDLDKACPSDIWFQYADLQIIKRKAMMVAKEANKYGLGSLLSNTYGKTCTETQNALITWTQNGLSRRGLERFINSEYSAKRSDIRRRTIKSVLRAQRKMKEEGITDTEYNTKVLSRLSEAFSQDSRNFARFMGIADEHAAMMDLGSIPDLKSITSNNSNSITVETDYDNDIDCTIDNDSEGKEDMKRSASHVPIQTQQVTNTQPLTEQQLQLHENETKTSSNPLVIDILLKPQIQSNHPNKIQQQQQLLRQQQLQHSSRRNLALTSATSALQATTAHDLRHYC